MHFASLTRSHRRRFQPPLAAVVITALAGCAARPPTPPLAVSSHPVITRLISRREVVTITAGPRAPLYTVADSSGRVLVSDVTLSDLKQSHPDLYERLSPALAPSATAWAGL